MPLHRVCVSLEVSLRIRVQFHCSLHYMYTYRWTRRPWILFLFSKSRQESSHNRVQNRKRRKGLSRTWRLREELLNSPSVRFSILRRDVVLRTKRVEQNRDGFHVWTYQLLYMYIYLYIHILYRYIYVHVMESFWALFCPSYCFFDSHAKWQPSTVFYRAVLPVYPDLISPLLLFLVLHPARASIQKMMMLSNSFLALGSGQIQLNMFPTAPLFIYTADMCIYHICTFFTSIIFSPVEPYSIIIMALSTNKIATDAYVKRHLLSPSIHLLIQSYPFLSFSIVKFYTRIDVFRSKN